MDVSVTIWGSAGHCCGSKHGRRVMVGVNVAMSVGVGVGVMVGVVNTGVNVGLD